MFNSIDEEICMKPKKQEFPEPCCKKCNSILKVIYSGDNYYFCEYCDKNNKKSPKGYDQLKRKIII